MAARAAVPSGVHDANGPPPPRQASTARRKSNGCACATYPPLLPPAATPGGAGGAPLASPATGRRHTNAFLRSQAPSFVAPVCSGPSATYGHTRRGCISGGRGALAVASPSTQHPTPPHPGSNSMASASAGAAQSARAPPSMRHRSFALRNSSCCVYSTYSNAELFGGANGPTSPPLSGRRHTKAFRRSQSSFQAVPSWSGPSAT
mmetsp:Transcript_24572/g.72785  ORF Transcript_24572/g.72785 Transcript_24572/m.72785 type:complete len:205 (+) Transcript_24572:314-928(+)